ncbi:helix-turn-helix domain-containing protein [Streptomyces lydicus]|uniref:helix-turn-helix domain-containing protein n=1 Tax=Streptomyces lydicus TaxID=47763 RepID=UPI0037ACD9D1
MDMSNDMTPEWLTVQEFAQHFRVSTRTVTRWVTSDPEMRVRRVGPAGRIIRIHRSELNRESSLPVPA